MLGESFLDWCLQLCSNCAARDWITHRPRQVCQRERHKTGSARETPTSPERLRKQAHIWGCTAHTGQIVVCAADSTDVCSHTRVLDSTHTCPCSCVHTCPYVSGHGLPIVTTSPAAPQKGLSAAIPLVGSRAASGLALFFPHEVSFPPPASGPLLPREFPLSCSRWQSAAGCQEKQGPARSTLLGSPPSCGSTPLPVGCDCSFPVVPPVPPVPMLHFGGLAL